jgi:hypothetical protein
MSSSVVQKMRGIQAMAHKFGKWPAKRCKKMQPLNKVTQATKRFAKGSNRWLAAQP